MSHSKTLLDQAVEEIDFSAKLQISPNPMSHEAVFFFPTANVAPDYFKEPPITQLYDAPPQLFTWIPPRKRPAEVVCLLLKNG